MHAATKNSRPMIWLIWAVASIFYAYQYILRVMPNIMLNDIMEQFDIGAAAFGQFSGIYYIGYSVLHLPVGIILDRFGPKKVMTGCILLNVVGLLPLILSDYWVYPIIGRFLIGLGSSAAILGVFKIIRMMFNESQFPRMLSLSVTVGLIGAIYGGAPISYMRETLGYSGVIEILAVSGLLLAVATYWILPNSAAQSQGTVLSDLKEVLGNSKVVLSCFFAGLMVGPLEGFADVWGNIFLKQVYGFDANISASLPSIIFIGMCFGAPVLSFIADRIGSYTLVITGAGVVMIASFCVLLSWSLSPSIVTVNFILIGVCSAYQILAIYKASTYVREEVAGITTAVANMIIMIFGYAFHSIIGNIVNEMGGPQTSQALSLGIVVIPIALCLGATGFLVLFILEKKTKVKELLVSD